MAIENNSDEYKALAEVWGEDMASRIFALSEKEKEKMSFSSQVELLGADLINKIQLDKHRRRTEGDDYHIKDTILNIENDPKYIEAKKRQDQDRQREADDEKWWNDFHKKSAREKKSDKDIIEKFGEETYKRYLAERELKQFNKNHDIID